MRGIGTSQVVPDAIDWAPGSEVAQKHPPEQALDSGIPMPGLPAGVTAGQIKHCAYQLPQALRLSRDQYQLGLASRVSSACRLWAWPEITVIGVRNSWARYPKRRSAAMPPPGVIATG